MPTRRQPGHREGVRRHQRYGQTAFDVGRTLGERYSLGRDLDDFTEGVDFIGTCQSCGSYLDVRQHETCPRVRDGIRCGGYIG